MTRTKYCTIRYTVTGKGHFPLDMLRHDRACPFSTFDSESMYYTFFPGSSRDVKSIELVCTGERYTNRPTVARWKSFGWTVSDVQEV